MYIFTIEIMTFEFDSSSDLDSTLEDDLDLDLDLDNSGPSDEDRGQMRRCSSRSATGPASKCLKNIVLDLNLGLQRSEVRAGSATINYRFPTQSGLQADLDAKAMTFS